MLPGEYTADDMKYSCIQFLDTTFGDFQGSDMWNAKTPLREDCLYLHIWVPSPRRQKRAVMVSAVVMPLAVNASIVPLDLFVLPDRNRP